MASGKMNRTRISAGEFDELFDNNGDISPYLDLQKATTVKRVNVDFSAWMLHRVDREALKLNISRQAVIKTWIYDRLMALQAMTGGRKAAK